MPNAKQEIVGRFICLYFLHNGFVPKISEIAKTLGYARRTVYRYLDQLKESGFIDINKGQISLINPKKYISLPINGEISAGKPIKALNNYHVLDLTDLLLGANRYVLQVVGDSMSGDNICDGDYIICEHKDTAANGQIVVALINDSEATLKRYYQNPEGTITLLPSNPNLSPMIYPTNQVKIQGVYLGLIRLTCQSMA